MSITILSIDYDQVIKSWFFTGETTYQFAIDRIYPLINRFAAQRKLQSPSFYDRLKRDLIKGCVMPPITLALINEDVDLEFSDENKAPAQAYINDNINNGYVLDGMQRLNSLYSVKEQDGFDGSRKIYVNLVISSNKDMLLYRMITLNNGQRPMTPRHQIEVLTQELFNFEDLEIDVQTEKERAENIKRGAFNLSDISKGYLAFFSGNVHNENNKIISEKMDEIIIGRIMSNSVTEQTLEFQNILDLIDRFSENSEAKTWLKVQNNLIGFCVGVKKSYEILKDMRAEDFAELTAIFESAFSGIDISKVNLGKYRIEFAEDYIRNIGEMRQKDAHQLLEYFSDKTA